MIWMWTLVLCLGLMYFPVPGSAQDPNRTVFLISGPEAVHAGTPTLLAVTVFADFSGSLTAELTTLEGDARVTQKEDYQGGLTRILTLPPIPDSIIRDSLLNLTVRGYRGGSLIFSNTTTLSFYQKNVSCIIQTNRSRYKPGDTIKVRVICVQLDNLPYKGKVDISIQDPSGDVVDSWESTGNPGIVLREFSLSRSAPLGQWAITTTVNGVNDEKKFIVEHREHLPFEVLVKTPSRVLVGGDISGSVRALYPSGQPVHGTFTVSVSLTPRVHNAAAPHMLTQTKEIYGSAHFLFSKDQLQALHTPSGGTSGIPVHVTACVTSSFSELKVNRTVEVQMMPGAYQLIFYDFPPSLRPTLHFFTKLRISRFDRKPLSSQDLMYSAVVEVNQRQSTMNTESTTLLVPVPKDGNIHVSFMLQEQVEMLLIRARFQSSEEILSVYKNDSSPSGSYIQISPVNTLPAQIGLPLQIDVESTFKPIMLHFVVSSRGQVVAAGSKNSSSFSLTPTLSWTPEAFITVYCIPSDGEISIDTAHIPVEQPNDVSLKWSNDEAQPGQQVSLSVNTLEPRSQVGIVVMGTHDDSTLEDEQDLKRNQGSNIRMLTNTRLYQKKPFNGSKEVDVLLVKYWSPWLAAAETMLWLDTNVRDKMWTSEKITVPDGVTALRAAALVMSDSLGLGFTPVPLKLTVSKDFSLSLNVPAYLIRGEEIVLEVNIINHLEQDIEVIILLAQSNSFEFVLGRRGDVSVINAQKLTLGRHVSASARFPIRPVALGEMEISVDAVCAEASYSLVQKVLVKPEGVEQFFSKTLFLELAPEKQNNSRSVSFFFPPDVVPGSRRAHVALVGEILALSFRNLDSLVQMPLGCGEQNMVHFAPSVYVLQYLDMSNLDNKELRSRALGYMKEGYERQLSYQRDDGSFSAFGASDTSGSIWLTAFVLRCFLQAQPYMQVDQSVLSRAVTWLIKHQGPQGEFSEVGRLIHTEMQGGLSNGPVGLTAYVLMALMEDETYREKYPDNVSRAQVYLENQVTAGLVSNYSLCLVAYALALVSSPVAQTALSELMRRADYTDGVMMWSSSAGLHSNDWQPHSAQIEMAAYVLLAFFKRASFIEGITLLKWLSQQRNHLGGYRTTQDTVIALQALSYYAAFSGASAIDLRLNVSAPASSFVSLFTINSTNYRTHQSMEVNADKDIHLNIYTEGRGFALFQMNIFYNVESAALSNNRQHASDEEAFSLDVEVNEDRDHNHMLLSICTRLKDSQLISHTGMVILDVGMLSGFSLSPGAAAPTDLIRKVEILPEKVSLYLDSLNKSDVCIGLPVVRNYKVARVQDAVVQLYDYYEPARKAVRTYNSDFLRNTDSCFFCDRDCGVCRPGINIIASSALSSHSVDSATRSFSCIFLGVAALFFL